MILLRSCAARSREEKADGARSRTNKCRYLPFSVSQRMKKLLLSQPVNDRMMMEGVENMKDTIGKAIFLGLGLAVAGKEQVERTIEELVKKGELSKAESGSLTEELVRKGEEAKLRVEELVRARVQALMGDDALATKADIERLEQRLEALERRLAAD